MPAVYRQPPMTFLPDLQAHDTLAAHWLGNVTLRLRRELCWLWRERTSASYTGGNNRNGALPPFTDRLMGVLDLARYADDRRRFFAEDETAAFLSNLISQSPPPSAGRCAPERGSFSWVARELALSDAECFAFALAIGPSVDSAAGAVYAACLNDPTRTMPSLALAQRLWDDPSALFPLTTATHPLFAHGLIAAPSTGGTAWDAPLIAVPAIAAALISPPDFPTGLRSVAPEHAPPPSESGISAARLKSSAHRGLRLVPVLGPRGAPLASHAAAVCAAAGRRLAAPVETAVGMPGHESQLAQLLTLAWLHGLDLYLTFESLGNTAAEGHYASPPIPPLPALPVTVFVGIHERTASSRLPPALTLPPLHVPGLGYRERLQLWCENIPAARREGELALALSDCARRFRYEKDTILEICRDLKALGGPPKPADIISACRSDIDLGDLAQPVEPRFRESDLMLPPKQARQFHEVIHAMRMLTTVHYEWGTARVWNEGGLSALFAGPPGTGKTMAAEVLSVELGLPLFRIDLSQVVNKYIGETEKNLRRVFDAAEASDVILFFDEADSLFGRRTEVKDAHDRYANLEVSYLLERMERFKGLAILATNRKRDLDEAFLRRLRFLIDFPLPGVNERLRIWKSSIPDGVDVFQLDFPFLAQRFPLAGGHIRSIVFQACLGSAAPGAPRRIDMPAMIAAVKREFDKLERNLSLEQFGSWAPVVEGMQ